MSLGIFRDPPAPPDMRASTAAAVREHLLKQLRFHFKDPEQAIMAEANTILMSNQQLRGYLALVELGSIHHETAANLMQRVPYHQISACVAVLTAAHERAVGL